MTNHARTFLASSLACAIAACGGGGSGGTPDAGSDAGIDPGLDQGPDPGNDTGTADTGKTDTGTTPAGRLGPENLSHAGAFRLPYIEAPLPGSFSWGGKAMTYFDKGDPEGGGDGYPGSLFVAGNDYEDGSTVPRSGFVAELGIPAPAVSANVESLPVAPLLQGLVDVRGPGLYAAGVFFELPKMGIQYLPARGGQTADTLYVAWGQHIEDENAPGSCTGGADPACVPSHSWRALGPGGKLDANPTAGPWWVEGGRLYSVNDYMFEIPRTWADKATGGRSIATGRVRDGGQGSQGPVLIAVGPWLHGNPPAPGATLGATTLLHYSSFPDTAGRMEGYMYPDEWAGGAWLETATKSAVVFAGAKAMGPQAWYGWQRCPGGQVPCVEPDDVGGPGCFETDGSACSLTPGHYCPCTAEACDPACFGARGWWTQRFETWIAFYDPADLEAVAKGGKKPHEPQPFAHLVIDDRVYLGATVPADEFGEGQQRRYRLGAVAYDRTRNLLYITEQNADPTGEQPVVHVWRVKE